ncbi:hypothetical protein HY995_03430 [Candidatus Micrarchaeota archaeon]|nr:hypothetical protein [Candidatus Micrarchaeota archaeon]
MRKKEGISGDFVEVIAKEIQRGLKANLELGPAFADSTVSIRGHQIRIRGVDAGKIRLDKRKGGLPNREMARHLVAQHLMETYQPAYLSPWLRLNAPRSSESSLEGGRYPFVTRISRDGRTLSIYVNSRPLLESAEILAKNQAIKRGGIWMNIPWRYKRPRTAHAAKSASASLSGKTNAYWAARLKGIAGMAEKWRRNYRRLDSRIGRLLRGG